MHGDEVTRDVRWVPGFVATAREVREGRGIIKERKGGEGSR